MKKIKISIFLMLHLQLISAAQDSTHKFNSEQQDINDQQITIDSRNIPIKNIQEIFLKTLDTASKQRKNLHECNDPIFLYVMQHKDSDMRNIVLSWLSEWGTTQDKNGETPLHRAISRNNKDIIEMLLLNTGVNKNIQDINGETPLHRAVLGNNIDIVGNLLSKSADVNIQDKNGETPLHKAVSGNGKEIVEMLIKAGADVNLKDENGQTANQRARNPEMKAFFDQVQEKKRKNIFYYATAFNDKEAVSMLIAAGNDVNIKDEFDYTPLYRAAANNNIEIAEILIAAGADVNIQSGENKKTPLHRAVEKNNKEIVHMLIAEGADVNIQNKDGNTPLHFAVIDNDAEIIRMLIAAGADINIQNKNGEKAKLKTTTLEMKSNDFAILGLFPGQATMTDVKKAYLKLSLINHPDKNKGNEKLATENFTLISNAYDSIKKYYENECNSDDARFKAESVTKYRTF